MTCIRTAGKVLSRSTFLYAVSLFCAGILCAGAGELVWQFQTGGAVSSSPAVAGDGTIYFGSENGLFYALNPEGSPRWVFDTWYPILSSPAIDSDGIVYIGGIDRFFYAFEPVTQDSFAIKWMVTTNSTISSSAAIGGDGMIYIGFNDFRLFAFQPDGMPMWEFFTRNYIQSSPVVGQDGTVYVGSNDEKFYAVRPDGRLRWEYPTGGIVPGSAAIAADSTIYVGSWSGKLFAFLPPGILKWNFVTDGPILGSPALAPDGTIYVGSSDNNLYAINPQGKQEWQFTTGSIVSSTPAVGSDSTIYVGSWDNYLYAINPDGTLKWSFQTDAEVASSPTITDDGIIYVGSNDGYLYAIDSGTGAGLAESPWPKFRRDLRNTGSAQEVIQPEPAVEGDVDGNDKVDIFDLLQLLKVLSGKSESPFADVNRDGKTDIFDLLALLKLLSAPQQTFLASSGVVTYGTYKDMKFSFGELWKITFPDGSSLEFEPTISSVEEIAATGGMAASFLDSGKDAESATMPRGFSLSRNFPNPFNPSTTISYSVPEGEAPLVSLKIYDLSGRVVRTLVNGMREAGTYSVIWDSTDSFGRSVSSGVYFYRLKAGSFMQTRKMVLLK